MNDRLDNSLRQYGRMRPGRPGARLTMVLRALILILCTAAATSVWPSATLIAPAAAAVARKAVKKSAPLPLVHRKVVLRKHFKPRKVVHVWRKRRVWRHRVHDIHHPAVRRPIVKPTLKRPTTPAPVADARGGLVTIAAGGLEGTDARVASDISTAVADAGVQVMPVLNPDSMQTLNDLARSPVVDVALVHSDVLDLAKKQNPDIVKKIGYIARLFDEEVCVLTNRPIADLHQLEGKKVGVDVAGSSDAVTAANVFGLLSIHPQLVNMDTSAALKELEKGDLDAVVIVAGEHDPALLALRGAGLHALPVPYDPPLQSQYFPAKLAHADYPDLAPASGVDTIAVGALLVAPLQDDDPARQNRIAAFARAFLTKFDALLKPGRDPKWKDVNLAADAPGWRRIPAAETWLDSAQANQEQEFDAFVASHPASVTASSEADHERLFREFVQWKHKQAH
ncbi:MAG TPA: ABC transporter substrate-binding protein [Beijerinckiaceae bacterium]|nr:ABC transporter substrate-binding protein [Beijerinckiaceae bacterium]